MSGIGIGIDMAARELVKKGQYDTAVKTTLTQLAEGLAQRQAENPEESPQFTVGDVDLLRGVIAEFCKIAQLDYAVKLLNVCPMELYGALGLNELIADLCKQRRFEMASRAIVEFKVLERESFSVLDAFITALFTEGQYLLAMNWAKTLQSLPTEVNLPESLCLTPGVVVQRMIDARALDAALKFIKDHRLEAEFPVKELVEGLVEQGEFRQAVGHIKRFGMTKHVPPTPLIEGMLEAGLWSDAIALIRESQGDFPELKLNERYTPTLLLTKMIDLHDWEAVKSYLHVFAFDAKKAEHKEVFVHFVSQLITAGELYKAMKYAEEYALGEDFSGEKIINIMIELGQHQHAMYFMKKLEMEDKFKDKMAQIQAHRLRTLRSHRRLMEHKRKVMEGRKRAKGLETKVDAAAPTCVLCELELTTESSTVRALGDPRDALLIQQAGKNGVASSPVVARSPDGDEANGREEDEEEIVLLSKTEAATDGKKQQQKSKAGRSKGAGAHGQNKGKARDKNGTGNGGNRRKDKGRGNAGRKPVNKSGNGRNKKSPPGPVLKNENVQILKRPDSRSFVSGAPPPASYYPNARPFPMQFPMVPRPAPGMYPPHMPMPQVPGMPPSGMPMPAPPFAQPGFVAPPPPTVGMRPNPNPNPNPNLTQQVQHGAVAKEALAVLQSSKPKVKSNARTTGVRLKIDSEKQFPSLGAGPGPADSAKPEVKLQSKPKQQKEEKSQATAQFLRPSQVVFKSKKKTSAK